MTQKQKALPCRKLKTAEQDGTCLCSQHSAAEAKEDCHTGSSGPAQITYKDPVSKKNPENKKEKLKTAEIQKYKFKNLENNEKLMFQNLQDTTQMVLRGQLRALRRSITWEKNKLIMIQS